MMLEDKYTRRPGPMGWGFQKQTDQERLDGEKRAFDQLMQSRPRQMIRRPMRQINSRVYDRVRHLMAEDGIEGGFSCRHMEKALWGDFLPWLKQLIGSCVASGGMRACARRTMIEAFMLNEPEELFGTKIVGANNVAHFAPYSYRAGRKHGGINGNMDGSFCGAHIEGLMDYGMIPCSTEGLKSDAFPEPQNTRTYKNWGKNNVLLEQFASIGRKFLLLESEKVTSLEQHVSALVDHFKPQMICSNWAFKPKRKHPTWKLSNGDPVWIYTRNRRASWPHNMTLDGIWEHNGERFTCVDNSWGPDAHKNGSFFLLEDDEMGDWIRSAEIQTIGDIDMIDVGSPV